MSQALSAVHIHAIFSTKNRQPYLVDSVVRSEVHAYLGGISRNLGCHVIAVGGVADHVHILSTLSRTITQADLIKELKRSSSVWLKLRIPEFSWQGGYGVFSVGASQIESVKKYISNQEEHHRQGSFQEEFLALLEAHGVEWDEKYVWD